MMTHSFPTRRSSGLPYSIVRRKGTRKPFRREQCSKKDRQIRRKCELIVSQEIEHAAENMRELNPRKDRSPELTDQLVQILGEPITVNFRISSPFEQHVRRSEEHTSELQSLMRISYAVFRL